MPTRNIAVTLECFIKKDGKYLMLHRAQNKRIMPGVWMAVGGHLEVNEGLFEAARREVFEETGLSIKNIRIKAFGSAYLKSLDEEFFFHLLFAEYAGGEIMAEEENGTLSWLTAEEILQLPDLLPELKEIGTKLFENDGAIISYKANYDENDQMVQFVLESA